MAQVAKEICYRIHNVSKILWVLPLCNHWQHLGSFTILDDELDFETLPGPIVHPQPRAKSGHGSLGKKRFPLLELLERVGYALEVG